MVVEWSCRRNPRPVAITLVGEPLITPVTAAPLWTRSSNAATGDIEPADLSCILEALTNVATLSTVAVRQTNDAGRM